MARWHTLSGASRETLWRSLHTLNITRIVIALVLLLYLSLDSKGGHPLARQGVAEIGIVYLLAALLCAMLTVAWRRRFMLQLGAQIALDIAVISLLYLGAGDARGPLAILYLFPLAGSAILAPRVLALFAVALVTLFLIGESVFQLLMGDTETGLLQSGVYGAAFFAAVLLLSRLASKLIGQEELAARRGADLDVQQAINRIVMADVGDGILVAAPSGQVLTSNPAAQRMLGLAGEEGEVGAGGTGRQFSLAGNASLAPIAHAFDAWLALAPDSALGAGHAAYVTVRPGQEAGADAAALRSVRADLAAHLRLRFARVDAPDQADGRCVIFLQDVTAIENQAQQLKLASMGRLTASIAHEVRNPLSAIGHATALLAEDLAGPAHARLLKIVGDNVARVNRMVEDILQLSRKVQPHGAPLALAAFLAEIRSEFQDTHALPESLVWLDVDVGANALVRFDALHLREVVVNLLNNAIRYASGAPASIRLFVVVDGPGRLALHVQDDGPGISAEVRAHLFEPFYTTSSKGTGLGLYLARELCLNNDAMLDYEYRFGPGAFGAHQASGRFVITFAQLPAVAGAL